MSTLPFLEALFFIVPLVGTLVLCVPLLWLLPRWKRLASKHSMSAAVLLSLLFGGLVFVVWAALLLFAIGVPGDENAGEVVVLYLEVAAGCLVLATVFYWIVWWRCVPGG